MAKSKVVPVKANYSGFDVNGLSKKLNHEIIASVASNVKSAIKAYGPMTSEKMKYYLERGIQDLATLINDANFELDGMLIPEKAIIQDIRFPETGAIIKVVKPFVVKDGMSTEGVSSVFSSIPMRSEYKQFISYRMAMPSIGEPRVRMAIVITMPDELIEEIGGGDYNQRTSVVNKYITNVLKNYLDK